MSATSFNSLRFVGPTPYDEDIVLYEAIDDSASDQTQWIYSCVALCRKNWSRADWPALGGTRKMELKTGNWEDIQRQVRAEAAGLAMSMYIKNSVLRHAEIAAADGGDSFFGWQGGKGIIWTPAVLDAKGKKVLQKLSPYRLMCHGRLVQQLGGEYVASKDAGVGSLQLSWIEKACQFTIGMGCQRDTGEATATGVLAGMIQAVKELGDLKDKPDEQVLSGKTVLVSGLGKVGLPLAKFLDERGARLLVFDPSLKCSHQGAESFFNQQQSYDAAVDAQHQSLLFRLADEGRIIEDEMAALTHREVNIFSPNGGLTNYLSKHPAGQSQSRAAILAATANKHGQLELVLGAGNDQITTLPEHVKERNQTLDELASGDLVFVPDPCVSPGGVIAVSHELKNRWRAEDVNNDTYRLVQVSVRQLFDTARRGEGLSPRAMYKSFEKMIEGEW